jgi:pimeloyl-ACP methyl ester carboxylesterase
MGLEPRRARTRPKRTRFSERTGLTIAAAVTPLFLLALPGSMSAAGGSGGGGAEPKPTIVLVHGAWAENSSWDGVVERLLGEGYPVVAAPNFVRGVSADAAYVRVFLSTITGPIVLVAHSYGGAVITNAATGNPNIKALVYVDAFMPDEGETVAELAVLNPGSILAPALTDPTSVFTVRPYPGAPAGAVDTYMKTDVFITGFAGELPRSDAAVLAATQTPASTATLGEPSGVPAWKTVPSWALIGARDNVIPAATLRFMAKRANATTVEVDAAHLSLVSRPDDVVALIRKAAG